MKKLYNGKTQKEQIDQLLESVFYTTSFLRDGKIQDRTREINIYFDNDGNVLSNNTIKLLKEFNKTYKFISPELKQKLNIDDNWEENCISINSECICQLLFFMDREDILSTIKNIMNCLCEQYISKGVI